MWLTSTAHISAYCKSGEIMACVGMAQELTIVEREELSANFLRSDKEQVRLHQVWWHQRC